MGQALCLGYLLLFTNTPYGWPQNPLHLILIFKSRSRKTKDLEKPSPIRIRHATPRPRDNDTSFGKYDLELSVWHYVKLHIRTVFQPEEPSPSATHGVVAMQ
jgi:hypothetical protein